MNECCCIRVEKLSLNIGKGMRLREATSEKNSVKNFTRLLEVKVRVSIR